MKEASRVEWARQLVEDQIARLGELRNANPRDPGFKLWRQTTLTIIQRIWPGDLARCERFRRIPFSPNSTKASRTQVKEHYERGCAEAATYLKTLMSEIDTQGVKPVPGAATAGPKRLPADLMGQGFAPEPAAEELADDEPLDQVAEPLDPRDMFEPSPLGRFKPPKPSPPSEGDEEIAPTQDPDFVFDLPAFQPPAAVAPPPPPERPAAQEPTPTQATQPAPQRPVEPAPSPPAPESIQEAFPPVHNDRRALKEMLGFVDEPRPATPASVPPAAPARSPALPARPPAAQRPTPPAPSAPAPPPPAPARPSRVEDDSFIPPRPAPAFAMSEEEDVPGDEYLEVDEPFEGEIASAPGSHAEEPAALPDMEIDFLSRVFKKPSPPAPPPAPPAAARPAPPPVQPAAPAPRPAPPAKPTPVAAPQARAPEPRPTAQPAAAPRATPSPIPEPARPLGAAGSPAATAFAAIAGEVDRLGVPEGQRAAARAALLDMARRIDDGTASWDSVCQILTMCAAYPAVARRALPLLVPYLEFE